MTHEHPRSRNERSATERQAYIAALVAAAPPLTAAQLDRLSLIFRPAGRAE
jgi:hypothetical protein